MRLGAGIAALALLIALVGPAVAAPSLETIADQLDEAPYIPDGVGLTEPFHGWLAKLNGPLRRRSPAAAAAALAPNSGLTNAQMAELIDLWRAATSDSVQLEESPANGIQRQGRFEALLAATHRAPLVLEAAAAAEGFTIDCRPDAFTAYLAGSADREAEGWMLVSTADCTAWYQSYIAVAPAKAALPLLKLADGGMGRAGFGIAVYAALASETGLARFHADDLDGLRARLGAGYLEALLASGLLEEAVGYYDSVPAAARAPLSERKRGPLEVQADGLALRLGTAQTEADIATDMIAAYLLTGRTAEAERMFVEANGPERVRTIHACSERAAGAKPSPECQGDLRRHDGVLLFADHILHAGDADPYPLAEMLAGGGSNDPDGLMAELRCRVFREPAYSALCEEGRRYAAYEEEEGDAANRAAAAAGLAALGAAADSIEAFERRLSAVFPPQAAPPESRERRASIDPLSSPFEERPLPPGLGGSGAPAPKGLAPLPDGYVLIRAEKAGDRAVAISASQNYDPAGEVSMGGYWVHLSEDGGRSWQTPLYTGLADRFPYVVLPQSPLPLLDGDSINLAVEVNLLDTATITYPPVGIRSRAKRSGIYLRISLEALRKDSDEDGLSDIAARHLLLDPESMASGTPVRLDGNGQPCTREEMAAQQPLRLLLEQVFGSETGAVMEPLDRKPDEMLAGKRIEAVSFDRPILIQGDPADFRCLRSRGLAVVYGAKDIERLQRMSPDFHAIEIRKILFNRAHDRGYVSWSAGWTGGTLRFRKTATGWTSEPLSSWIT
ncbi:MAG: hypothetical protein ACJ8ER_06335 [Allosphingosinicella sp.]